MPKKQWVPDWLFESSWEVCNKVGGIYTVLSTRAETLQRLYPDAILFIGPDLAGKTAQPDFRELPGLLTDWKTKAAEEGLPIRIGRWDVPGQPLVVLVNFDHVYARRNAIFTDMWTWFGVDSLPAYGDYDESCMFAWACGEVIASFIRYQQLEDKQLIAHFNEWTTGMGLLYCKHFLPKVATVFTTHATSIGRSICGNNLPLYDYLSDYQGDRMARQLNMISKHSLEKITAAQADCFTTVSDITAKECACLLECEPDVVTPNGFEPSFVKQGRAASRARNQSRRQLLKVAGAVFGYELPEDTLFVGISGRYEYRNKGLDVFVDSLYQLKHQRALQKDIVGVIMVPADVSAPRQEVIDRLAALQADDQQLADGEGTTSHSTDKRASGPIYYPFLTHWLHQVDTDRLVSMIRYRGFGNGKDERVKLLFVPCYLDGNDGIFNLDYYALLPGFDLTVFPSYYEPWGYTPLESIAFSVPTITTNLAGFGAWVKSQGDVEGLSDGVAVVHRSDHNYAEVMKEISLLLFDFAGKSKAERKLIAGRAAALAAKAQWTQFIDAYQEAYAKALQVADERHGKIQSV